MIGIARIAHQTYAKLGRSLLLAVGVAALAAGASTPAHAQVRDDPGTMSGWVAYVGKTFDFAVTGSVSGPIWGTDVYKADSHLATAAVHAGVLRKGEQGVVRVTMVPGRSNYAGSTRNGVVSQPYDLNQPGKVWPGSFRFETYYAPNRSFDGVWYCPELDAFVDFVVSPGEYGRFWDKTVVGYQWMGKVNGQDVWRKLLNGRVRFDGVELSGNWDDEVAHLLWPYYDVRLDLSPDGRSFEGKTTANLWGAIYSSPLTGVLLFRWE